MEAKGKLWQANLNAALNKEQSQVMQNQFITSW